MNTTHPCTQSACVPAGWSMHDERKRPAWRGRLRTHAGRALPAILLAAAIVLICALPLAYLADRSVRYADIQTFEQARLSATAGEATATIVRFEDAYYLPQSALLCVFPEAEVLDLPLFLYGETPYVKADDAAVALSRTVRWDEAGLSLMLTD
ncbi:hypothetical protein LJC74_09120 [Eubacteriales bacterium OttesenSCG-928-A19]|nr:hypothetical protein [Eubacteriales bacterium OttesenSCG-928-A19]